MVENTRSIEKLTELEMQVFENVDVPSEDWLTKMSQRMRRFAEYYATTGNILRSTTLAGYSPKDTGHGHALLKREDVQRAVEYYREVYAEKSLYTAEKLVRQWALMASIDLTEYLNDDFTLKTMDQLTEQQREHLSQALVGIETVKSGRGSIGARMRFAKVEALENLGRLMKLYDADKSAGEGLILNINVGQERAVEATAVDVGPFTIHIPEGSDENA